MPESNLSIIPDGGGTQRLARIIGKGRATGFILTGDWICAEQAEQMGLVTSVVPPEELWETVVKNASKILAKDHSQST